ncbi:hypothetical protein I4U23_025282, partial [Adineta vaga]
MSLIIYLFVNNHVRSTFIRQPRDCAVKKLNLTELPKTELVSCSSDSKMLGFKAKNLENIDQQYKCKICSRILRNPVQLKCGHRQCKSCVEYSLQAERLKCPECSQETHQNEIRPDKGAKNDMKVLEIFCSYCDWNGSFREYETHLQQAHTNPICEYCNKSFDSINNLELHQAKDCSEITIPCALKDYGCTTF